jgi:hypothetical protein
VCGCINKNIAFCLTVFGWQPFWEGNTRPLSNNVMILSFYNHSAVSRLKAAQGASYTPSHGLLFHRTSTELPGEHTAELQFLRQETYPVSPTIIGIQTSWLQVRDLSQTHQGCSYGLIGGSPFCIAKCHFWVECELPILISSKQEPNGCCQEPKWKKISNCEW